MLGVFLLTLAPMAREDSLTKMATSQVTFQLQGSGKAWHGNWGSKSNIRSKLKSNEEQLQVSTEKVTNLRYFGRAAMRK